MNIYLLADLEKLDPYQQFVANPSARIPITTFANQNDYATLLLAYLPTCLMMFVQSRRRYFRWMYLVMLVIDIFMIYRSESRMILLSLVLFFAIIGVLEYRLDVHSRSWLRFILTISIILIGIIVAVPTLRDKVTDLFYFAGQVENTGDSRRMNLWRNGLLFVAQTFGMGVGAGNIEVWMAEWSFMEVDTFTNIHNWWLEILVGYGVGVFIAYLIGYGLMFASLFHLRRHLPLRERRTCHYLIAFLTVFIFASITSANNMLIEWHWVYFGLIISYIKVMEQRIREKREGIL